MSRAAARYSSEDVSWTFADTDLGLGREACIKLGSISTEITIEAMVWHHWGEVRWEI